MTTFDQHTTPDTRDVHDHITELTRPHTHTQPITRRYGQTTVTTRHHVDTPSLLRQLEWIQPTGRGDDRSAGGYESRPAAALDAMATLQTIDTDAARWLRILGGSDRGDTDVLLRRLGSLLADRTLVPTCHRRHLRRDPDTGTPCCAHHQITADVRRWWTQARVATGWDSPAWRPDNTCPACAVKGGLRIKDADKIGYCTECRETWTEDTIGLLAEHCRVENAERKTGMVEAATCWCVWPAPAAVGPWPGLCPACGSRHCHRAQTATRVAS